MNDQDRERMIRQGVTVLQQVVHKTAKEHGWWDDEDVEGNERNMGEMIALMHSELSEALESVRSHEPYLWFNHGEMSDTHSSAPVAQDGKLGKPEGVASEFADTIIRIMDTCQKRGIPLAEAIIRKAAYNETRPYKHGGRAF